MRALLSGLSMAVDRNSLRDSLRFWSSGVSIVATTADDGRGFDYAGMTVSAFNSLSLDPPQVLVCVAKNTTTTECLRRSGIFSISMLSADQAYLSDRFAGRIDLPTNAD